MSKFGKMFKKVYKNIQDYCIVLCERPKHLHYYHKRSFIKIFQAARVTRRSQGCRISPAAYESQSHGIINCVFRDRHTSFLGASIQIKLSLFSHSGLPLFSCPGILSQMLYIFRDEIAQVSYAHDAYRFKTVPGAPYSRSGTLFIYDRYFILRSPKRPNLTISKTPWFRAPNK